MTQEIQAQLDEFRDRTAKFASGDISVKDYKGFSGKFGSYAQKGARSSMLRLRMTGGRLSVKGLLAIKTLCEKYNIDRMHCTTCETIQLHDIPLERVADALTDAVEAGFYTFGCGGDFPRNVMVSPLSGVERDENFDVYPYAEKAAEYLLTQIDAVKMPRKLKVCFSNSQKNAVHATFRDLGFVSRSDGKFDVYCAGGMGNNPKMGVKVADAVDGTKLVYYIRAMILLFCKYGNYENRAKARTRYMQEVLGDTLPDEYNKMLEQAFSEGGLDIAPQLSEITKQGDGTTVSGYRFEEQKQPGLYAVKFHPIGGTFDYSALSALYDAVKDIPDAAIRLSPDETIYIINLTGKEAQAVADATAMSAVTLVEQSVACIGASVCQQGLRDSQALVNSIIEAVKPHNFSYDALPTVHISGCTSSCGTHQIGRIGFHGKAKMVDKKPQPAFSVHLNGNDAQGFERFGEELGVMLASDIPKFMVELGTTVTNAGTSYDQYESEHHDELVQLIEKYI